MLLFLLKYLAVVGMVRGVRDLSNLLCLWVLKSDVPPNARFIQFLLESSIMMILGYWIGTLLVAGRELSQMSNIFS